MSNAELLVQGAELVQGVQQLTQESSSIPQSASNWTSIAATVTSLMSSVSQSPLIGVLNPTTHLYNMQVQAAALGTNIGQGNYLDATSNLLSLTASLATLMAPQAKALSIALSIASLALNQKAFGDGGNWFDGLGDWNFMSEAVASEFNSAQRNRINRDPLVLDLDGDGIETVGTNAGILFDHNNDGIKTGTGWVKSDDGLLAIDLNNNGKIDTGNELFGVDMNHAIDGFMALRTIDSDRNGIINAADTQFNDLRVWRDLNQNSISEAGELKTLTEPGIASINLTSTAAVTTFTDGNRQTATSTFTRTDGMTGTVANLGFAEDTSRRLFTAPVPLTSCGTNRPNL